jgi:hypothetical protein
MQVMTERDPAFLWETAAIRSATHRIADVEIDTVETRGRWRTLREASTETGIPVETLRNWARRETIPSYLAPAGTGTQVRLVDLDGVTRRAAELGREIPGRHVEPPRAEEVAAAHPSPAAAPAVPPGSMIIPVDAWNKMLTQLGNLHEAGQQLAEARERAAKAETEASFLRERLAEMRKQGPEPSAPASPERPGLTDAAPPREERVRDFVARRLRDWRRG